MHKVQADSSSASHDIWITKPDASFERVYSGGYESDEAVADHFANPSMVLKLEAGTQVGVKPAHGGTVIGHGSVMKTWFGMTLLYAE